MKEWKCLVCGYVHKGETPPETCVICGVSEENFQEQLSQSAPVATKEQWKCLVCGYVSDGDKAPTNCPICGVNEENFQKIQTMVKAAAAPAGRRWKCLVCDYIHEGDEPPTECPLCGVGPDKFVELVDSLDELCPQSVASCNAGTIRAGMEKISYGLYIVTSHDNEGHKNGQCVNTVIQLTDTPPRIAVSINKNTLTHEYIMKSGVMAISFVKDDDLKSIRHFGLQSGRKVDKMANVDYIDGVLGCPVIKGCVSYLEGKVLFDKSVDVGTHTLFVVEVVGGRSIGEGLPLTYDMYRQKKHSV